MFEIILLSITGRFKAGSRAVAMLRRKNPDRADGKQRDTSAGKGTSTGQHQEDEEEEYPDNVDCEEYDEEDVYVMVELPTMIDTEAFTSAEAVTIKVTGSLLLLFWGVALRQTVVYSVRILLYCRRSCTTRTCYIALYQVSKAKRRRA